MQIAVNGISCSLSVVLQKRNGAVLDDEFPIIDDLRAASDCLQVEIHAVEVELN